MLPDAMHAVMELVDRELAPKQSVGRSVSARLKSRAAELAILGGTPLFDEPLHVGRPNLPDRSRFHRRIDEIFDHAWLTNDGRMVREFEQRICAIANVRNCIAVSNGTTAISVAAHALGISGEAIVPALTFVATPHALAMQGIKPVFADVDPHTFCIDPDHVERLITERTTAIVGVHLWGRPCHTSALERLADRYQLKLLFDAAHAFGCSRGGRMIGGFGNAETFSFHATKFVTAGEGGAITTNDDALADKMRQVRNFGFADIDVVECVGTNAKLNELNAALGITSLEAMSDIVATNRRNFEIYRNALADIPGISLLPYAANEKHNHQYVVIRIDPVRAGVSRDFVMTALRAENILARRYFFPGCHRAMPYCDRGNVDPALPVTDQILTQVLSLPTGTSIDETTIAAICRIIRLAVPDRKATGS